MAVANTKATTLEDFEEHVVKDYIPLEMIQSCEKEYNSKKASDTLTNEDKFLLAWYLIKSRYKNDVKKGIEQMGELCRSGMDQRDQYYFLALGHYKLEEYQQARLCIDRVLNMEANNAQAKGLKELIDKRIKEDSLITAGIVGVAGAVALGGAVLLAAGVTKLLVKR